MGLLAEGTALEWEEASKYSHQVREWGIKQLLEIWNKAKTKERDAMLWGDETEYLVVTYSKDDPKVLLSLRQAEILDALEGDKDLDKKGGCVKGHQNGNCDKIHPLPVFHPEFGRFMLEATPGKPWGIGFKELLEVEADMRLRRKLAKEHMRPNEYPITLTTFPSIGVPGVFTDPYYPVSGPKLRSQFVPDEIANPHIRFPTLAANIRTRRGRKVQVNVPVFKDVNTPSPWKDPTVNYDLHNWPEDEDVRTGGAAPDDFIHMDAMAFGMGSCCLQITFQAKNINEGRTMYDQLSPLGPVMLALTAATPVYKGFLADTDVRWNQISRAVDDRTAEEMGEKTPKGNNDSTTPGGKRQKTSHLPHGLIPKSRYASNSTYISTTPYLRPEYMSPSLPIDPAIKLELQSHGMDDLLATHFAHLFIRDPLVIFAEDLQKLDLQKGDHFENLQSTNWQHIRFKPPPAPVLSSAEAADGSGSGSGSGIGWRVEFRPMEIQITDFENAAFCVFMVLMTRVIVSFGLDFYVPIERVDENMEIAHRRGAITREGFWFRRDVFMRGRRRWGRATAGGVNGVADGIGVNGAAGSGSAGGSAGGSAATTPPTASRPQSPPLGPVEDEYRLMSVDEIINGTRQARQHAIARREMREKAKQQKNKGVNGTTTTNTNTSTAQEEDEEPHFADHLLNPSHPSNPPPPPAHPSSPDEDGPDDFPGLIPLVESYLSSVNIDIATRCELSTYLALIRKRASGELWTAARWIREFVASHGGYKHDSVVGGGVVRDLIGAVVGIGEREGGGGGKGRGQGGEKKNVNGGKGDGKDKGEDVDGHEDDDNRFEGLEKEIPGFGKLLGGFRGCGKVE